MAGVRFRRLFRNKNVTKKKNLFHFPLLLEKSGGKRAHFREISFADLYFCGRMCYNEKKRPRPSIRSFLCFLDFRRAAIQPSLKTESIIIMKKKTKTKDPRIGIVGGQAVLEGVMMKSGDAVSLAVRGEDGKIRVENSRFVSLRKKVKFFNLPILRGCVSFVEQLSLSMDILTKSAEMLGIEDEPETKFEKWVMEKCGNNIMKIVSAIGLVLGLLLGVGLFLMVPTFLTSALNTVLPLPVAFLKSLIEGLIRMGIFVLYIWAVSLMSDIRRTYEYHGAEHKSVACFEAGLPLTPENAKTCTRFHPRCGTSFIFVMLFLSIILNSFLTWNNVWLRFASKLLMIPLIVGIGFEFLMFAGTHTSNPMVKILSAPGLWLQRITTREPDEEQLAVAITALRHAIPPQFEESLQKEEAKKEEQTDEADDAPSPEQPA